MQQFITILQLEIFLSSRKKYDLTIHTQA